MSTKREKKLAVSRTVEGELMSPTPARIQLHSLEHTLREARRIYRLMASGEIDVNVGGKLIWALTAIAAMTKDAILEARITALEESLEDEENGY